MSEEEAQPEPIIFTQHVFDFAFHPSSNLVAVGLIDGQVECYKYSAKEANERTWSTKVSKKSCRGVEFTHDGAHLMSISRDKSIQALDVSTGRLLYKIPKAHTFAINKICKLDTHLTATGDDDGIVKIWDMRTCKALKEYKVHDDFISGINFCPKRSSILATAGDGLLSIYDIRQSTKNIPVADVIDDELLSLAIVKDGEKVVAGSQSGALYMWDWGQWDTVKKWIGHPSSVDSLCKLDENAICTGGSDGLLRLISIAPQNFEGVLGDHGQDFPIECVKLNHEETYLASCGHDLHLKFWNVQFLFDQDQQDSSAAMKRTLVIDVDEEEEEPVIKRAKSRGQFFENL